jgi:hypothetical protein
MHEVTILGLRIDNHVACPVPHFVRPSDVWNGVSEHKSHRVHRQGQESDRYGYHNQVTNTCTNLFRNRVFRFRVRDSVASEGRLHDPVAGPLSDTVISVHQCGRLNW